MTAFRFTVADKFSIAGRGPIVMGKVESGAVWVGQSLRLSGKNGTSEVHVVHIEKFKQEALRSVAAGPDDVGMELEGVALENISAQDVLVGN